MATTAGGALRLSEFAALSLRPRDDSERSQTAGSLERPDLATARRITEPTPSALLEAHYSNMHTQAYRPRSPYHRQHLRSRSAATLSAPPMARAHSAPTFEYKTRLSPSHSPVRPSSPLRSPAATRPPPRKTPDEMLTYSGLVSFSEIESISEDSELAIAPRAIPDRDQQTSPLPNVPSTTPVHSHSFPRTSSRRGPSSPLHHIYHAPTSHPHALTTSASSPSLTTARYVNEPFPTATPHAHRAPSSTIFTLSGPSSLASTPTSFRSRSPSISSLETIPDIPDAERAAIEADELARLKAANAVHDDDDEDNDGDGDVTPPRRSSLEVPGSARGAAKEKRKRWSVCGAERRGDFEMETIWED